MRIVGEVSYKGVCPATIEEIEKNEHQGFNTQVILDADRQVMILVV